MQQRFIAELLGTFGLLFFGSGAIVVNQSVGGAPDHNGICLVWGMIVFAMILAFGDVSGTHINPAVSVAFAIDKRFPWKDLPAYLIAQALGAFAAIGLLKALFPINEGLGGTYPSGAHLQSFVMEVVLMFFLMLVILNVSTGAKEKGITASFAIAAVVALEALVAGPISGASMNPIRSLAPALMAMKLDAIWIYLTAPFIGAILAVFAHRALYSR